jgi:hypothetical protein
MLAITYEDPLPHEFFSIKCCKARRSFRFDSLRLAHPLVAWALNIMTEEGEIRCFKNVTPWRWQRIIRPENLDADINSGSSSLAWDSRHSCWE